MKSITYVAAIALLTAGTAFAQSSDMNSSSSMPKPAQAQSMPSDSMAKPDMSGGGSSPSSASMNRDMDQSSKADIDTGKANGKAAKQAQSSTERRHVASRARTSGNDARENQETAQLNRQQLGASGMTGGAGQTAENPFDRGSPQYPQAGSAACSPDRPDCGTARDNPAIQSSPQQRMYNASPQ
jgi:hypothetical protein